MVQKKKKKNFMKKEVTAGGLTLPPELVFDSFHSSVLLNEFVDDLGGLLVFQLSLIDAANIKQVLQLRVQVIELQRHNVYYLKRVRKAELRQQLSGVSPPAGDVGEAQL